jgi:hypothetical protein
MMQIMLFLDQQRLLLIYGLTIGIPQILLKEDLIKFSKK